MIRTVTPVMTLEVSFDLLAADQGWARASAVVEKAKRVAAEYDPATTLSVSFFMDESHGFPGAYYDINLRTLNVTLIEGVSA